MDKGDSRMFSALCSLGVIIFPILVPVIILFTKGKQDKFVKYHALQAIIYQALFFLLGFLVLIPLVIVSGTGMVLSETTTGETAAIGMALYLLAFLVMGVFSLISLAYNAFGIYAAFRIFTGKDFAYPYISGLAKKYV